MKLSPYTILLAAAILAGCGSKDTVVTGADGSSVSVSKDGTNVVTTAADGTKVTTRGTDAGLSVKDSKGQSLEMNTDGVKESDLGLPFYPGSSEQQGGSLVAVDAKGRTVYSLRKTKDDPSKVLDFYKDKITASQNGSSNIDGGKLAVISGKLKDGSEVAMSASKTGDADTVITITVKTPKK